MRFLLNILVVLLVFTSCQDIDRVKKPDNLIPKGKMADILVELSLLQGAKSSNRGALEQTGLHPRSYIWERFDIDSIQFTESNNYYSANYREYEEIYKEVKARVDAMKVKYDTLMAVEKRKRDALGVNPEDSLEQVREQQFRDSILALSEQPRGSLTEPVSADSIPSDTIEDLD